MSAPSVTIRMEAGDLDLLKRTYAEKGVSLSEYIREAVLGRLRGMSETDMFSEGFAELGPRDRMLVMTVMDRLKE